MARVDTDSIVTLSILDRLIDNEPSNRNEAVLSRAQSVRTLKSALRRDLEWLLNTRRIADDILDGYPDLAKSAYGFGLPDFTSFSFANVKDRARLLRALESAIRNFEPRLMAVRVVPLETQSESGAKKLLRFQIEGLLRMDPAPERVSFDTVLQLTTGEYQVKGDAGA
ncbi:MAG: type VI secretion system baseplate subunit TssE [Bryobacteraceae bacterium]